MNYTRYVLASVVVLAAVLVVPALAGAQTQGEPQLSAVLEENRVSPGADTTLEVSLLNTGRVYQRSSKSPDVASRVTTARGLTVRMRDGNAPIEVHSERRVVGTLPEGTAPVSFDISVDEDAETGTHRIPLVASYSYTASVSNGGSETQSDTERTLFVEIDVEDDAQLRVVDVETDARVGSTGTVDVTVENSGGGTANATSLRLESANGDLTIGGASAGTRSLGQWDPGERRTVTYAVTPTTTTGPQAYAADLTATYEGDDGRSRTTETRAVAIEPRPEQTFAATIVDSTVRVGDSGTVAVSMRNEGPIGVSGATVELAATSPDITFGGSDTANRFVGEWAPGENRTFEFDTTAGDDADTRSYVLEATVSYLDGDGESGTAPSRSLGLVPRPEQSFDIGEVDAGLAVGEEGTLSGTVTNTGPTAVDSAAVVYTGESETVTAIESESPVGDLGPGESATFSLPFEVASSAESGPKQLPLAVQYRNEDRDRVRSDGFDVRAEVAPDDDEFGLQVMNASIDAGSSSRLRVRVTNDRAEPVSAVSAKLFAEDPLSSSDDEAFIDRLEPGQSETVLFDVSAGSAALPKSYPLTMDFQYDDSDGDTLTSDTYRLALQVTEDDNGGNGGPPVVLVLVVLLLVAGGVGYYRYRR